MTLRQSKIITIDGPSGAGKSTIAKLLALRAGYTYIDSGAIYRGIAYAYKTCRDGMSLEELLQDLPLTFEFGKDTRVTLSGKDISEAIRKPDISLFASSLSQQKLVRDYANTVQRGLAAGKNAVLEGRDTGSVVFPDADIKFYLDARPDERAQRRYSELASKGSGPRLDTVKQEMEKRDSDDSTRDLAPLVVPDGAIIIDTTATDVEGVMKLILAYIDNREHKDECN